MKQQFFRICEVCDDIKRVPSRHAALVNLCKPCSLIENRKKKDAAKKMFRICEICGDKKQVYKTNHTKNKHCKSCSQRIKGSMGRKPKAKIKPDTGTKTAVKEKLPQLDRVIELAMQDDWIKNNKIKVG